MKFSFFHLMPWTELEDAPTQYPVSNRDFDPVRAKELYDTYHGQMAYAEECGFDWVACNEHHFSPYGLNANCNLVGSAMAYRTKTAKIAMLGNLIPLLNPVRVAEEYAMIDCMSGGRLIAGFVRGIPHEYIAYNHDPNQSRDRLREAIQIIVKAWTETEPFGWEGEHYQFSSISIWPKPWQKPHPQMLMSASNEESAAFAGQYPTIMGMTLIADLKIAARTIDTFRESSRAHGHEITPDSVLTGHHTCIAETDEEAREHMREALKYFHKVLMRPQQDAQAIVVQGTRFFEDERLGQGFTKRLETLKARTLEDQIEAGSILCGSPETVVKQIKRINAELGNGRINMTMKVGTMPDAVVRRGMELFRDRVLPELRNH
jgi:alkanesulfonate monooxygenase SsuD/methylene tetrahydromethanopterin reductase-like flavin-dependent oxidoreductase (luciferase family)